MPLSVRIYGCERMKLTRLLDYANIQHYYIEGASSKFKKRYPKRFIYAFREGSRVVIGNEDKLPPFLALHRLPGFVFTYSKVRIDNVFVNVGYPPEQEQTDYPVIDNLDRVFKEGCDVALSFLHNKNSPVGMPCDSLEAAFSIKEFMELTENDIIDRITDAYIAFVNGSIHNTEQWVEFILELVPLTRYGLVPRYPKTINDDSFKETALRKGFKLTDLYLTYDVHAHTNKEEYDVAHKMDRLMVNPDFKLTVYDDYTELATRLKKLIKKPLKADKDAITFTFKQYCDITDGRFTILDCI